jgi:hypothetical protein
MLYWFTLTVIVWLPVRFPEGEMLSQGWPNEMTTLAEAAYEVDAAAVIVSV